MLVVLLLTTLMMVDPPRHCPHESCDDENYLSAPDGRVLKRLNGRQIRSIFSGVSVTYQAERWGRLNMYPVPREEYFPDGTVAVRIDRSVIPGKWRVRGNLLCITRPPTLKGCRKVYASGGAFAVRLSEENYERVYFATITRM